MASTALHQTRTLFPTLRSPWGRPGFAAALLSTFLASQRPFNWVMPSLQSVLDLFPPFLLAVPKKKVSHSRKAMRSSNKGLKDKKNIVNCPACGQPKLAHHLCSDCYSNMSRKWKSNGWGYTLKEPEAEMDMKMREGVAQMVAPPKTRPITAPRTASTAVARRD